MKIIYTILLLLFLTIDSKGQSPGEGNVISWIGNSGFHIQTLDGGILIDAILNNNDAIADAEGPYADVKLIFISHVHGDHFHPKGLLNHLRSNQDAIAILTPESFQAISKNEIRKEEMARIIISLPDYGSLDYLSVGVFNIHVLQFEHSGVQNIGFGLSGPNIQMVYLNGGFKTQDAIEEFSNIYSKNDVAIANKWPLVKRSYTQSVYDSFRPDLLLMAHHAGENDPIIINNGGKAIVENIMTIKNMKGRIFTRKMELAIF